MVEGDRVRNVNTGREDIVLRVGPCENLEGHTRIWLEGDEAGSPSNGWDEHDFKRNWAKVTATDTEGAPE